MDSHKLTRQLIRTDLKTLTGLPQSIWQHLQLKGKGMICFFKKNFDLELFLKKMHMKKKMRCLR